MHKQALNIWTEILCNICKPQLLHEQLKAQMHTNVVHMTTGREKAQLHHPPPSRLHSFTPRVYWSSVNWLSRAETCELHANGVSTFKIEKHSFIPWGARNINIGVWKIQALRHCRSLYMCRTVYFMHWGRQRSCVPGIWGKEEYTCLGDHATLWSAAPDRRGGAALAAARGGEGRVPAFPSGHARCTWKKKNSGKDKKREDIA